MCAPVALRDSTPFTQRDRLKPGRRIDSLCCTFAKGPLDMNHTAARRIVGCLALMFALAVLLYGLGSPGHLMAQSDEAPPEVDGDPDDYVATLVLTMTRAQLPESAWVVVYAGIVLEDEITPEGLAVSSIITWRKLDADYLATLGPEEPITVKLPPPEHRLCPPVVTRPGLGPIDVIQPDPAGEFAFFVQFFSAPRAGREGLPDDPTEPANQPAILALCQDDVQPFNQADVVKHADVRLAEAIQFRYPPTPPPPPTPTAPATPTATETPSPEPPTATPTPTPTATATQVLSTVVSDALATAEVTANPDAVATIEAILQQHEATRQAIQVAQMAHLQYSIQALSTRVEAALAPTPVPPATSTPDATAAAQAQATLIAEIVDGVIAALPTPRLLIPERRLTILDQETDGAYVTVVDLATDEHSWLVIYDGGGPDQAAPIGLSHVSPGIYDFWQVLLSRPPQSATLRAVLYADRGQFRIFEPGVDPPLVETEFALAQPSLTPTSAATTAPPPRATATPTPIPPLLVSFVTRDNQRGCGAKNELGQPEVVWGSEVIHIAFAADADLDQQLARYRFELVAIPDGVNVQVGADRPAAVIGLLEAGQNERLMREQRFPIMDPKIYTAKLARESIYQLGIVAINQQTGAAQMVTGGGCFFKLNPGLY